MVSDIHDVDQYLNLIRAIGIDKTIKEPMIKIPANLKMKTEELISISFGSYTHLIGLHLDVSSTQYYKQIGFEKWVSVIESLDEHYPGALFCLLGGKNENTANKVSSFMKRKNIIDFTGKMDLLESAAFIEQLDLIISNDSSLKTIADTLGTPSVIASGCTNYIRSRPIKSEFTVVRVDLSCSPCDIFGNTDWDICSHHNCVKELDPKWITEASIATIKDQKGSGVISNPIRSKN